MKEVRDQDFLIARRFKRDIYLSLLYIDEIRNGTVVLNIPSDRVGESMENHPAMPETAAGKEKEVKPRE